MTASIIFVIQYPLDQRDMRRFGIEYLCAEGFEVAVLDVGAIVFPHLDAAANYDRITAPIDIHVVNTASDLRRFRSIVDGAELVVCLVGSGHVTRHSYPVIRLISASKTPYLLASTEIMPMSDSSHNPPSLWRRLRRMNLLNTILNRLPLALIGLRPADHVVLGGDASNRPLRLKAATTNLIWGQSEIWQEVRLSLARQPAARRPQPPYAVYIDQYFGFHPDSIAIDRRQPIEPEHFYSDLRRLFDRIEAAHGLSVVIAAHPKADWSDKSAFLGGRKVNKGNTFDLIRDSRLVIASYSLATGGAVLMRKPLFLFTTPEISGLKHLNDAPTALARALSLPIADISRDDYDVESRPADEDDRAYAAFEAAYLKSDRSNGQHLGQVLERLCSARRVEAQEAANGDLVPAK